MCTTAVSRTAALNIGISHPSSHRPPGHPACRRWRQLRPRTRRLQIPVNHGPLRRALPLAPRTCHTHMRRRPLTRLRRYHLCSPAHLSHRCPARTIWVARRAARAGSRCVESGTDLSESPATPQPLDEREPRPLLHGSRDRRKRRRDVLLRQNAVSDARSIRTRPDGLPRVAHSLSL